MTTQKRPVACLVFEIDASSSSRPPRTYGVPLEIYSPLNSILSYPLSNTQTSPQAHTETFLRQIKNLITLTPRRGAHLTAVNPSICQSVGRDIEARESALVLIETEMAVL
jgi:hypothetical protein